MIYRITAMVSCQICLAISMTGALAISMAGASVKSFVRFVYFMFSKLICLLVLLLHLSHSRQLFGCETIAHVVRFSVRCPILLCSGRQRGALSGRVKVFGENLVGNEKRKDKDFL